MLDRAAYIGGCDGVSTVLGAESLAERHSGTMPHSLALILGDTVKAAQSFDKRLPSEVPRIVLVDTFGDEKVESLRVAQALGKRLHGVRLDTPSSRRGDIRKIVEELRWELDLRGFQHVRIYVSGGLDEPQVAALEDILDGFGIGTSLSNAPVLDFAADIVEIEGKPIAKKGKFSGRKQALRCEKGHPVKPIPWVARSPGACPLCGAKVFGVLQTLLKNGKLLDALPSPQAIRKYVLSQLPAFAL